MPTLVNGEEVSEQLIDREIQELRDRYRSQSPPENDSELEDRIRQDALANAIEKTLLQQQAREQIPAVAMKEAKERLNTIKRQHGGAAKFYDRIGVSPGNDDALCKSIQEQIRLEKMYAQITRDVEEPTADECRVYYEENPDMFKVPEQIRVSHFVRRPGRGTSSAAIFSELLNIRESLIQGADFGDVVSRYSDCKDHGGDLGYISRQQMVDGFDRVAFALNPGEISEVFQTEFGYHIVKMFDRIPDRLLSYDEAAEQIRIYLVSQRKNAGIGEYVDELLKETNIEERDT
jgi:parvulin-like peptidyl-prolyl isomerase